MRIDEAVDSRFRGVIYGVKDGKERVKWVNGYADLPNQIPNTLETRFASASAGKVFVAVGVLQLIERGALRFEDTLGHVLPMDWRAIDPGATVRQLLTHTSGVPDYFDESTMSDYEMLWKEYPNYKIRHNADLLQLFIDKPMKYPHGLRFEYNNTGYVLLAMMIEKITGMDFDVYIQKYIFDTCAMRSTGYFELDRLPARCANSYIPLKNGEYRTNIYSVDVKGTGAGGAFITVGDIVRFWEGLVGGKLLERPLRQEMLRKQSGDGQDGYGYGVWIRQEDEKEIPYIQGCDPGVSFLSEWNPRRGTISVLVSNYGDDVWKQRRAVDGCLG